jgi:hypothetical protein
MLTRETDLICRECATLVISIAGTNAQAVGPTPIRSHLLNKKNC